MNWDQGDSLEKAAQLLKEGEVVAIPTETVYGLAANALDEAAVEKIFKVKNRPGHNPLIVHIGKRSDLDRLVQTIDPIQEILIERFWPGPLTILFEKSGLVPKQVTAGLPTVGIRMPSHPVARKLLDLVEFPLAAPSANPSGLISPTNADIVRDYFKDLGIYVLDGGNSDQGLESSIVSVDQGVIRVHRLGTISLEDLESLQFPILMDMHNEAKPVAPGMMSKHYSPRNPSVITDRIETWLSENPHKKVAVLSFSKPVTGSNVLMCLALSPKGDFKEAAKNLYSYLYALDRINPDVILCERVSDYGIGKAINDRLSRACAPSKI